MTVIAALAHEGSVFMAADTVASTDRRWYNTHKIVRKTVAGRPMLLAFAGRAPIRNAIQNELHVIGAPKRSEGEQVLDEWAHEIAAAITDLLYSANPPIGKDDSLGGNGLLAYQGCLWTIEANAADRCELFEAIGSGEGYALGALHALQSADLLLNDPKRSVTTAIEAASRWEPCCGGPIDIEVI